MIKTTVVSAILLTFAACVTYAGESTFEQPLCQDQGDCPPGLITSPTFPGVTGPSLDAGNIIIPPHPRDPPHPG